MLLMIAALLCLHLYHCLLVYPQERRGHGPPRGRDHATPLGPPRRRHAEGRLRWLQIEGDCAAALSPSNSLSITGAKVAEILAALAVAAGRGVERACVCAARAAGGVRVC